MTVSGVTRGEQRKLYDLRKEQWARDNKIKLLGVSCFDLAHKNSGKLTRDSVYDYIAIKQLLEDMDRN